MFNVYVEHLHLETGLEIEYLQNTRVVFTGDGLCYHCNISTVGRGEEPQRENKIKLLCSMFIYHRIYVLYCVLHSFILYLIFLKLHIYLKGLYTYFKVTHNQKNI